MSKHSRNNCCNCSPCNNNFGGGFNNCGCGFNNFGGGFNNCGCGGNSWLWLPLLFLFF